MSENYLDLIDQKKKLIKKLENLNARQFGATSNSEMESIAEERKDVRAALEVINKKLNPEQK